MRKRTVGLILGALVGAAWLVSRRSEKRVVHSRSYDMDRDNDITKQPGYWCLACGRYLEATETEDGRFVILHDKEVDHSYMTYDEEDHPQ